MENNIEVEGLIRKFKNGPLAVAGIDLHVDPGEIYGFLGPNGAGKSTTVHMLTTLLPPTEGTARVAGHDIVREGPAVRAAIGAALQEAALDPHLTGREHMRLQTALHGLPREERVARGDALIERVGLLDAADRKVGGYSGGMKRRLDLALALVHGPRVLFLDEPTTGLDPQSRAALWDEVVPPRRPRRGSPSSSPPSTSRRPTSSPTGSGSSTTARSSPRGRRTRSRTRSAGPASRSPRANRPRATRCSASCSDSASGCRRPATRSRFVSRAAPRSSPTSSGRSTPRACGSTTSTSTPPSLDDVFLEKTGRHLEGAGDDGEMPTGEQPLEGAAA